MAIAASYAIILGMSVTSAKPWTVEQFFAWGQRQEGRFEFDGQGPVAMTGGTLNHSVITLNLHAALRAALRGSGCHPVGPHAGVATASGGVRYPDALVTCGPVAGNALTVPGTVAVFEVISPGNSRTDRITKVREYAALPSILSYVMVESTEPGVMLLQRDDGSAPWTAFALIGEDELRLHIPALATSTLVIPVAALYEDVSFEG